MPLKLNGITGRGSGSAGACACEDSEGGISRLAVFCYADLDSVAVNSSRQITGFTFATPAPEVADFPQLYVTPYVPDSSSNTAFANQNGEEAGECQVYMNAEIFGQFAGFNASSVEEVNKLKSMFQPVYVVEFNNGDVYVFGIDVQESKTTPGTYRSRYAINALKTIPNVLSNTGAEESRIELRVTGRLRYAAASLDVENFTFDDVVAL